MFFFKHLARAVLVTGVRFTRSGVSHIVLTHSLTLPLIKPYPVHAVRVLRMDYVHTVVYTVHGTRLLHLPRTQSIVTHQNISRIRIARSTLYIDWVSTYMYSHYYYFSRDDDSDADGHPLPRLSHRVSDFIAQCAAHPTRCARSRIPTLPGARDASACPRLFSNLARFSGSPHARLFEARPRNRHDGVQADTGD